MRVLLAVDASLHSRNATHFLEHLADPPSLSVLNVVDIGALRHAYPADLPGDHFEAYRQEVAQVAERVLHETRDNLAPYAREVRLVADSGDPAESIIQTAEDERAELIVLGHRGMTAKSRFLLGGVSQKVATYAPCSVLVVKQPTAVLDRVLLAVDGSDASMTAAQFLLGAPFKAPLTITIVTVWASPRGGDADRNPETGDPTPVASLGKARGEDLLREVAEHFRSGPYGVQSEWWPGDPPSSILDAAGRSGAQLVVVGARGMKGIKRFLLGSVSQKVLAHAPCSVLIVR